MSIWSRSSWFICIWCSSSPLRSLSSARRSLDLIGRILKLPLRLFSLALAFLRPVYRVGDALTLGRRSVRRRIKKLFWAARRRTVLPLTYEFQGAADQNAPTETLEKHAGTSEKMIALLVGKCSWSTASSIFTFIYPFSRSFNFPFGIWCLVSPSVCAGGSGLRVLFNSIGDLLFTRQ